MSLSRRSTIVFPLVLLSALALLTFWINLVVQPPKPKLDGSSRHDADYVMSNFVTTQTDINGVLRYKLAAVEMTHFPDDDTTNLLRPRYTQFAVGKPYTQAEGLRGYVSSNGDEVQLVDNVKVTRQAFAEKGEMTVETNYLNIRPNEEFVSTKSLVVIKQAPKTVIYATGMIYEKKARTVTLLHKVRAHYENPRLQQSNIAKPDIENNQLKNSNVSKVKPVAKVKSATVPLQSPGTIDPNSTTSNTNNARIRRRYE